MQNKYYYLIASLPYLKFGSEPPISSTNFIAECGKWLGQSDMKTVLAAKISGEAEPGEGGTVLAEWKTFDRELRHELALIRAAHKKGEEHRGTDMLKSVLEQENPFLMEKEMERIRWSYLEEKSLGCFFDLNRLVLYFVQLQIVERMDIFDKDKGESYFYKLCEVNYEQAIG
ncbi:MAG: DUF2764 family protein [Candidatus Omnitrophota bacterium]